jgi:hypothetical protein
MVYVSSFDKACPESRQMQLLYAVACSGMERGWQARDERTTPECRQNGARVERAAPAWLARQGKSAVCARAHTQRRSLSSTCRARPPHAALPPTTHREHIAIRQLSTRVARQAINYNWILLEVWFAFKLKSVLHERHDAPFFAPNSFRFPVRD